MFPNAAYFNLIYPLPLTKVFMRHDSIAVSISPQSLRLRM